MEEIINTPELSEEEQAEALSEQVRIRREKLENLRKEGKDPFKITTYDVSAYSEDIKANFKNGILQLTFPKEVARKEDEETKYITID